MICLWWFVISQPAPPSPPPPHTHTIHPPTQFPSSDNVILNLMPLRKHWNNGSSILSLHLCHRKFIQPIATDSKETTHSFRRCKTDQMRNVEWAEIDDLFGSLYHSIHPPPPLLLLFIWKRMHLWYWERIWSNMIHRKSHSVWCMYPFWKKLYSPYVLLTLAIRWYSPVSTHQWFWRWSRQWCQFW